MTDGQFRDRTEAGQLLATKLLAYDHQADVLVMGLPRGGVPVAAEVANVLHVPLDICLVRKLGVPSHKELAMGAIASGGVQVLNHNVLNQLKIPSTVIDEVITHERQELQRRELVYRGDRTAPEVRDRTVILVDDGVATGSTMRAAIRVIQEQHPQRIIVAVPVAAVETCEEMQGIVDEVVCIMTPDPLHSISYWYEDFAQTTDSEVCDCLQKHFVHPNQVDSVD
jgi:putative phosphoribosyl transferase